MSVGIAPYEREDVRRATGETLRPGGLAPDRARPGLVPVPGRCPGAGPRLRHRRHPGAAAGRGLGRPGPRLLGRPARPGQNPPGPPGGRPGRGPAPGRRLLRRRVLRMRALGRGRARNDPGRDRPGPASGWAVRFVRPLPAPGSGRPAHLTGLRRRGRAPRDPARPPGQPRPGSPAFRGPHPAAGQPHLPSRVRTRFGQKRHFHGHPAAIRSATAPGFDPGSAIAWSWPSRSAYECHGHHAPGRQGLLLQPGSRAARPGGPGPGRSPGRTGRIGAVQRPGTVRGLLRHPHRRLLRPGPVPSARATTPSSPGTGPTSSMPNTWNGSAPGWCPSTAT